jgi:hypothetical protein
MQKSTNREGSVLSILWVTKRNYVYKTAETFQFLLDRIEFSFCILNPVSMFVITLNVVLS